MDKAPLAGRRIPGLGKDFDKHYDYIASEHHPAVNDKRYIVMLITRPTLWTSPLSDEIENRKAEPTTASPST